MDAPLWQPSAERIAHSNITAFREQINRERNVALDDFAALHRFSLQQPEAFWSGLWSFAGVIAETRGERVLLDGDKMPGARWFPEARLNFAENLLRRRDEAPALIFGDENGERQEISARQLHEEVSRLVQALQAWGVVPGDRVAGLLPNLPETVAAMLATTSLGAIWSSCSPDFGVRGVLDRFGQIQPKVLFAADGYFYGGTTHHVVERITELAGGLPSLERIVVVPYTREDPPLDLALGAILYPDAIAPYRPDEIPFARLPFDHPLYVLYSSGTTGMPKCIVHGAGGTLLQHLKEQRLHVDLHPRDRLFYFTTCGWMMWNWLVSGLASEATLLLYDGSPFHPDGHVLFEFAEQERMTVLGTSAKYLDAVAKAGLEPGQRHDLSGLKTLLSTGSPLLPESFDFIYEKIGRDLCVSSMSGGTDIVSCFVLGCPVLPVRRGEIQCRGLGMAVEVYDEQGRSVQGEKGELVCTAPFPSMPLGFWNDPEGKRYRAAYFERFPGVWCHGDFAERTPHDGMVIYGRSDAVLNPGGVRIGTAEIYREVEQIDEVLESLVIGQEWQGDTRVVLFVRLREGVELDEALTARIRQQVRQNASPRHTPARVVQVADIPRTRSGKIVELAVREVVHGRRVLNREALANPESLELFTNRPELSS